nr:aminomethyl-transferring glycine dehydrogenase [Blastococcus sp. TML/C7B]
MADRADTPPMSGSLPSLTALDPAGSFAARHIGPRGDDTAEMLRVVGHPTLESLADACVPEGVRDRSPLALPPAADEAAVLAELRERAAENDVLTSMIGLGYYGTVTPSVIQRTVLENPAWYTAYTPYQPEISQGRLEALINFQTMVADLTGLDVAGASMLDEATAAAEAMTLVRRAGRAKPDAVFVVDADTLPQTLAVLETRAEPLGIALHVADLSEGWPTDLPEAGAFGVLLSYPGASGAVRDHRALAAAAHEAGASVVVAADLLALTLLEAPGEWGADVACGTTQRFGVPMGYGGPHAGYLSVREGLARQLPGRLVGVSVDADGDVAYRLALQTREQHIRREKATSNICTAQVLLAVMAGAYAVYHGPEGLAAIAARVHRSAVALAGALRAGGVLPVHEHFFDTVTAAVPGRAADVVAAAAQRRINLRLVDADTVAVACDETTTPAVLREVAASFGVAFDDAALDEDGADALPGELRRRSAYLTHPVFSAHRSETSMLRYLRSLSDKDLALDRTMIPLGSCTMKLNAATEMAAITWPEFAGLHPFAPVEQARGYTRLIDELCGWLAEVTGYAAVSVQPNAGSQGEFAGLLAIRGYHRSRGDEGRDVCLIPSSAHGTNAASAVMAGMRVVVVACDEAGNVDLGDLRAKVDQHAERLAAIMLTYPSTHGVYETEVREICAAVHDAGGQVYVDGANLNALVGLARPRPVRLRRQPPQPAQDLLHPARRWWPRRRPDRRRGAPGAVPPGPPAGRHRHERPGRLRRALRVGGHPADLVGLRPAHGPRRADPRHRARHPRRELPGQPAARALPGALHRCGRHGRARVHPGHPAAHQGHRHHQRRHRQAAHRLRLPRADDELPGRRHADGRADRERGQGGAGPVRRGDGDHPRRDREGGDGGVRRHRQPAAQRPAHAGDAGGGVGAALPADDGDLPGARPAGAQLPQPGPADRPGLRRPQSGLRLPADRGVRRARLRRARAGRGRLDAGPRRRGTRRPRDDGRRGGRAGLTCRAAGAQPGRRRRTRVRRCRP